MQFLVGLFLFLFFGFFCGHIYIFFLYLFYNVYPLEAAPLTYFLKCILEILTSSDVLITAFILQRVV